MRRWVLSQVSHGVPLANWHGAMRTDQTYFPGAAGLSNPPGRSKLRWPSTDAFALIWLLKQDVPHYTVRHLANSLNKGFPAHVGTDGSEIETQVGEQMYSILNDYARRRTGRPW